VAGSVPGAGILEYTKRIRRKTS